MKIARNVAVSERHVEWYAPIPGSLPEGVSPDEWKTPFVGAMKIARNLPLSGRSDKWYAPHPGSLPEGAAERSEAEGVSSVEW